MTTLISDTFADANGVTIPPHLQDVGPGWSAISGTFSILGNKAVCVTGAGAGDNQIATNARTASPVVTYVLGGISGSALTFQSIILVRYVDASNNWKCGFQNDGSGGAYLYIQEVVAGSTTTRGVVTASAFNGSGHTSTTVTVTLSGSTISIATAEGDLVTYGSMSTFPGATGMTLEAFGGVSGANTYNIATTWDTLLVTGTAVAGALFRSSILNGLGAGGPLFNNPLGFAHPAFSLPGYYRDRARAHRHFLDSIRRAT